MHLASWISDPYKVETVGSGGGERGRKHCGDLVSAFWGWQVLGAASGSQSLVPGLVGYTLCLPALGIFHLRISPCRKDHIFWLTMDGPSSDSRIKYLLLYQQSLWAGTRFNLYQLLLHVAHISSILSLHKFWEHSQFWGSLGAVHAVDGAETQGSQRHSVIAQTLS